MKRGIEGVKSWGRKKETSVASFSAVAVSGGLQGGRRNWTGKEERDRVRGEEELIRRLGLENGEEERRR